MARKIKKYPITQVEAKRCMDSAISQRTPEDVARWLNDNILTPSDTSFILRHDEFTGYDILVVSEEHPNGFKYGPLGIQDLIHEWGKRK